MEYFTAFECHGKDTEVQQSVGNLLHVASNAKEC